jgi:surface antigen
MSQYKLATIMPFLALLSIYPTDGMTSAWDWLEKSPVSYFTPEDKHIMRKTARDVLENGKDGTKVSWENPETGHSGSITPISNTKRADLTCRKTRFFNSAEGLTSIQLHLLCKQADGTWKIFK